MQPSTLYYLNYQAIFLGQKLEFATFSNDNRFGCCIFYTIIKLYRKTSYVRLSSGKKKMAATRGSYL